MPFGASWQYLDNGSDQGTGWQAIVFQDSAWKSGPAILGYGKLKETTEVDYGPDANNKYITTYFRKTLTFTDTPAFASYTANIKRDDGAVVYVNGKEVYRNNLPAGPINYLTRASSAPDNGSTPQTFTINASAFVSGTNVITVEVHQTNPQSFDLVFDLELLGNLSPLPADQTPPTVLSINRQSPATKITTDTFVSFRVIFSEPVTGVDRADFTPTTESGTVSGFLAANALTAIGTTGTTYDITVSAITGAGELRLDLKSANTGIADQAGNAIGGGYTRGQSYTVQQSQPGNGALISFNSTWRYLDNGSDQDTAWQALAFQDAAWKNGPAVLGYGNLDEATVVGYGPDAANKYITTYFRKTLLLADSPAFTSYTANIKRDDGAVVYVNGKEVYRNNLPAGTITYTTLAFTASDDGRTPQTFQIPASAFKSGTNVMAVELHQASRGNTDLAFDLELKGNQDIPPTDQTPPTVLSINRQSPASQTITDTTVTYRITFSEPVTGVDATDFLLTLTGTASGNINTVAPFGSDSTRYDATVQSITGEGTLRLDLKSTGAGIADTAGNGISSGYTNGQTYSKLLSPTQFSLTRGPYLQMGSQSAVTLRWRTNKATDSKVEVGTTYGSYTLLAKDASVNTEHEVRISGLSAGTRYYYRFGSDNQVLQSGSDNYFYTAPAADNPDKVRIAVFGDCGRNDNNVQTNTLSTYRNYVGNKPAELLLLLGDNAYENGTDADYQKQFFDVYSPNILRNHVMFPTPGNHDYHTTSQASRSAPYYKIFSTPTQGESGGLASGTEAYYSYDWGNIHFISMDSYGTEGTDATRLYDTLGAQVTWVKKDLAANTKPWVIVYWHHPPYSMGSHNSDTEGQMADIRRNFVRILERNGVDLVLTGHSHNYERSYLIRNHYGNESSFNASEHAVSTSSGKYNGSSNSAPFTTEYGRTKHGTVYVVSGSAGALGDTQSKWPHNAMPFSDNKGGMLYLEVEQNRLDARYLRSDGVVWDQFTIMKGVNKKTNVTLAARESTQLTASWVGTYQWSTGETTRTITVDPESDSTYQVTDDSKSLQDSFQVNRTTTAALAIAPGAKVQPSESYPNFPHIFPTFVSRGARITVEAPTKEQAAAMVVDINGRLVYETTFNGTTYLETAGLPIGMYLIRLQGKNYVKTQKFIVR